MRSRTLLTLGVCAFTAACRPNTENVVDAAPGAADAATMQTPPSAAPSMSGPPPAASVPLGDAPDVRLTLPASGKIAESVVKVGQTFGILVPMPDDFEDEWELENSPIGAPLTFISRGAIGRELLWKIGADAVGPHVIELRLMHKATRESKPVPARHVSVPVDVVSP